MDIFLYYFKKFIPILMQHLLPLDFNGRIIDHEIIRAVNKLNSNYYLCHTNTLTNHREASSDSRKTI